MFSVVGRRIPGCNHHSNLLRNNHLADNISLGADISSSIIATVYTALTDPMSQNSHIPGPTFRPPGKFG